MAKTTVEARDEEQQLVGANDTRRGQARAASTSQGNKTSVRNRSGGIDLEEEEVVVVVVVVILEVEGQERVMLEVEKLEKGSKTSMM